MSERAAAAGAAAAGTPDAARAGAAGTAPAFEPVALRAGDGCALSARFYGNADSARGAVVIAPAMGVPQRFYAEFAAWLAEQGWATLTFDYRGIGESRSHRHRASLRGFEADLLAWAERDAEAALHHLRGRIGRDRPLVWLGHSVGAQIVGLLPSVDALDAVVTIAAGSGYWRENVAGLRWRAPLLWYVVAPVALRASGYFPGAKLGMVGDLPAGVMRQWRRWCLHPEYLMAEGGTAWRTRFARVTQALLSLSFTDDEFMSVRNIESLHGFYTHARKQMRRLAPADVGARRIGHFGFFRAGQRARLWPEVTRFLESLPAPRPASNVSPH